jgi:hypothetical protein
MTPEIFYQKSFYLIDEQCHPCLFEMNIENPEVLDELTYNLSKYKNDYKSLA